MCCLLFVVCLLFVAWCLLIVVRCCVLCVVCRVFVAGFVLVVSCLLCGVGHWCALLQVYCSCMFVVP